MICKSGYDKPLRAARTQLRKHCEAFTFILISLA